MKTGENVETLGLYSTDCCNMELIFEVGDTFCRCPRCQNLCQWELDEEVVSAEDLDKKSKIAA